MKLLTIAFAVTLTLLSGVATASDGMTTLQSAKSQVATVTALKTIFDKKGITLFAEVDHQKGADSVGQSLRPTTVLIFGNPKLGSPLMACEQAVALDLPQKMLIHEDAGGKVWLSYNDPAYLQSRHSVKGCDAALSKVAGALKNISAAAASAPK